MELNKGDIVKATALESISLENYASKQKQLLAEQYLNGVLFNQEKMKMVTDAIFECIEKRDKGWDKLAVMLLEKWIPTRSVSASYGKMEYSITNDKEYKRILTRVGRGKEEIR